MAVDRTGAAERLAARREDAPAGGVGAGLLRIAPVDARIVEGLDEAGRQMDVRVPVGGPGLQHADCRRQIFAQAVGQHAAGRTGADNHVVEGVHACPVICLRMILSENRFPLFGIMRYPWKISITKAANSMACTAPCRM